MIQVIQQLKTHSEFQTLGVFQFKPKIYFEFAIGTYTVKTVQTKEELIECFRLRNEVFNKEFRGLSHTEFDFDQFDVACDHIIIVNNSTRSIVGTYRLNCSLYSQTFYSEQEFEIRSLRFFKGPLLELGRACIAKEFRKGSVINLLWRGIAEYMNRSYAQVLFGCSSVKITDAREAALIYQYLKVSGHLDLRFLAKPQPAYEMDGFVIWNEYFEKGFNEDLREEAEAILPSLLKSYIKMGAKIISEPAYDGDFDCVDYLTLLTREQLLKTAGKKYGVESGG